MASNFVRLAQSVAYFVLFKISFLFILARRAKMNRKLILKSPRFVPFVGNMAHFETKYDLDVTVVCAMSGALFTFDQ